jgi:hypothetical protein
MWPGYYLGHHSTQSGADSFRVWSPDGGYLVALKSVVPDFRLNRAQFGYIQGACALRNDGPLYVVVHGWR